MRSTYIIASLLISFVAVSQAQPIPSPTHIKRQGKHNEQDSPTQAPIIKTKTLIKNETLLLDVTTVVVVAAGGNNQVMGSVQDENEETTFEDQLEYDQEALHRTALILALVGGLIGIAIVASIVIFTKMRIRRRRKKQPYADDEPHSTKSPRPSSYPEQLSNDEPSAPPLDNRAVVVVDDVVTEMRPAPSAPTAKELDAEIMPALYPMIRPVASSSQECPHCFEHTPPLPEIPPPAYTPSAPPLFALPLPSSSSSSEPSFSSATDTVNDLLFPPCTRNSS